jgi:nucleoredoxin
MDALLQNEPLLTKAGAVVPLADALAQKKVVGLYFSGHYCPPCRKFTPLLAQVYEEIKEEHDDFEIIFVSSDKEIEKYDEYFTEMPWIALPWAKRDLKAELCTQFGVKFIPTLIFFNDKGEVVEREGRTFIEKNAADIDAVLAHLRK